MLCIGIESGHFIYIVKISLENEYEYGTVLQFRVRSINLKVFQCIQVIFSKSKLEKYEYCTILHFIIQFIYFKVFSCMYRICNNRQGENKNIGQYSSQ